MFPQSRPLSRLVPYTFPPISFLKLKDYITNLVNTYGGVYWPLDDVANNPYNRVINTAVAVGRQLALTPDFATDTNWAKSAGCTISGGVGVFSAVTGGSGFLQAVCQIGKAYRITFDVVVTSGTMNARAGSTGTGATRSVSGTYTDTVICSGSTSLGFVAVTTFTGTIDNVSCVELNIPAYNVTPSQLLNTDVWNNGGTAAWTAQNSATLSMQTTTRHDGSSGTVLRVFRASGSTVPQAAASFVMTPGQVYRVYGWARSDGLALPRIQDTGSGAGPALTASTDWQPYDFVRVWVGTEIELQAQATASINSYVEFDVTVVALDTGIRTDANIVQNGTFSADASWAKNTGATISGGTANFSAVASTQGITQTCLCVGKRYKVTFDVTSFTSGAVRSTVGNAGQTYAAIGTYTDILIATQTSFQIVAVGISTLSVDNISITELSPLVALPVNGAVLGNSEAPLRIGTSVSFDGVNDLINLYSAQLNSVFPINEGTLVFFFKTSSWTAGTKIAVRLSDGVTNNLVQIYQSAANQLTFIYEAGGTTKSVVKSSVSSLAWHCLSLTWSKAADQVIAYFDNVQEGSTQTGLGSWNANFSSAQMVLAGFSTGSSNAWGGNQAHLAIISSPLAIDYISEISKLGDAS